MKARMNGTGGCRAQISARNVATGRSTTANHTYSIAREWAAGTDGQSLLAHPASAQFRAALPSVPLLKTDSPLLLYRGRLFAEGKTPQANEFGPPPNCSAPSGRYGLSGSSVLYLCNSEEGVRCEVLPSSANPTLWCQRFLFQTDALRIADFSQLPPEGFVCQVLFEAERAKSEEGCTPTFAFSQTVATLVASCFDGMFVPGVQGADGHLYRNLVLFRQDAVWASWLDKHSPPFQLNNKPKPA